LTTLEMLDLLEAHLAGLRMDSVAGGARGVPGAPPDTPVAPIEAAAHPEELRTEMQASGLSVAVIAESLGVSATTLEDWVAGRLAAPAWALTTLRLVRRLAHRNGTATVFPQARAKQEPTKQDSVRRHPFSQIEDL
jgi:hypothetical protein